MVCKGAPLSLYTQCRVVHYGDQGCSKKWLISTGNVSEQHGKSPRSVGYSELGVDEAVVANTETCKGKPGAFLCIHSATVPGCTSTEKRYHDDWISAPERQKAIGSLSITEYTRYPAIITFYGVVSISSCPLVVVVECDRQRTWLLCKNRVLLMPECIFRVLVGWLQDNHRMPWFAVCNVPWRTSRCLHYIYIIHDEQGKKRRPWNNPLLFFWTFCQGAFLLHTTLVPWMWIILHALLVHFKLKCAFLLNLC